MIIELKNIGKKFNKEWIFRKIDYRFDLNNSYAITGANGSGKSTLLQIISGFVLPSEGEILVTNDIDNKIVSTNQLHQSISITAPYLELIEEMTAIEFLEFHFKFKKAINNISNIEILQVVQLEKAVSKQIRFFSSGMKQRLKLAQAFFTSNSILLLDEPCSNLDKQGIQLYHQLISAYSNHRMIIICSNDEVEYSFCNHKLELTKPL